MGLFHSFLEAWAKAECGGVNRKVIKDFLSAIRVNDDAAPILLNQQCNAFDICTVQNAEGKVRFDIALAAGPLRNAIVSALSKIPNARVCSGDQLDGFFEEELTEWLGMLQISKK